ncbi:MAG: ribosomal L7Ae/L30e/S12e/Gadd45 family protein [Lachnospiraceae bacterium]|jgi:ribosomal protein L7Ae-like RNA K-turn-binding protein|nr:ribosomal L7Ae/L30e/S12e/Gadd45 family protein [Lachnospiraceae bacterium]
MNMTLSILGICKKAGKIKSGSYQVEEAVKMENAFLVIVSEDASENTKKKYRNMCEYRQIPIYTYSTSYELGHAIGQESRAVVAVIDKKLALMVMDKLALR